MFKAFSARHLPIKGANLKDWPDPPEKTVIFDFGLSNIKLTSFVIVYGLTKVSSQLTTPSRLLKIKLSNNFINGSMKGLAIAFLSLQIRF